MGTHHSTDQEATHDDPRFTMGLVLDVADVLHRHGYPKLSGAQWADLQLHLSRALPGDGETKGLVEVIEQPEVTR